MLKSKRYGYLLPEQIITGGIHRKRVRLVAVTIAFMFIISLPSIEFFSPLKDGRRHDAVVFVNNFLDSNPSRIHFTPLAVDTGAINNTVSTTTAPPAPTSTSTSTTTVDYLAKPTPPPPERDPCLGKYIYIHELPSKFNDDLLKDCKNLGSWTDFCEAIKNQGFGPNIQDDEVEGKAITDNGSWFKTDQFTTSVIFHNRLKSYECRTMNSSLASAIYVPFYAGLEIGRHLWGHNASVRDEMCLELVSWLRERREWKDRSYGMDHFFVSGRITWDFRRSSDPQADWGNQLMNLPESKNLTMLTIESSPWTNNDFAIPYPGYFHPSDDGEVSEWQEELRRHNKRDYLFAFAGAPRPNRTESIRGELIRQCMNTSRCQLLACGYPDNKCDQPAYVMKVFKDSVFCLQPTGDSATRRSTFDSILAGCIPVFFYPGSAYTQYVWYLPKNYTKYSVFIPEKDVRNAGVSIEKVLSQIPEYRVLAMRDEVIKLIPKVTYARTKLKNMEDAFDVAVRRVLEMTEEAKKDLMEGQDPRNKFPERASWKYYYAGTTGEHEWDSYF